MTPDHPRHYVWTTKEKEKIQIKDMTDSHLHYTIRYLEQQYSITGIRSGYLRKLIKNKVRSHQLFIHIMKQEQAYRQEKVERQWTRHR